MPICCLGKSGKVKITKVAFLTETACNHRDLLGRKGEKEICAHACIHLHCFRQCIIISFVNSYKVIVALKLDRPTVMVFPDISKC